MIEIIDRKIQERREEIQRLQQAITAAEQRLILLYGAIQAYTELRELIQDEK